MFFLFLGTGHVVAEAVPKKKAPVQRLDAVRVPTERVSSKAAFDNMLNEMQSEAASTLTMPYASPVPATEDSMGSGKHSKTGAATFQMPHQEKAGTSESFRAGRTVSGLDNKLADTNITGKAPVVESAACSSSSDSQSEPDGIIDPWVAIRSIFERREKRRDDFNI